jgi:hypothetical protein
MNTTPSPSGGGSEAIRKDGLCDFGRTRVYVDGFNLYYLALRGTPYRWLDLYDTAVVISNDSDLAEPIRIVTREIGKKVGILCPAKHPVYELYEVASFYKPIRRSVLAASQFPEILEDRRGIFRKPPSW